MFVVQNINHPGRVQNALYDLMRGGMTNVRICSAYITMSGSEILFDGICRSAQNGDHEQISKTIVTSLDFGLTDPEALQFWNDTPNTQVLVAGATSVESGNLNPSVAYHPKIYVFDKPDGTTGSLVGSANLTNRGLTINSEVAWLEDNNRPEHNINRVWETTTQPAIPLTPDILDRYRILRDQVRRERPALELEPVPQPGVGQLQQYQSFRDIEIDFGNYDVLWIQSRGLQGGAHTQLEMPRGSHRFFGAEFGNYNFERVDHIAEPVLVSGNRRWNDRHLTWHGDNAMERINLPSLAMGGFEYENSLIFFRRIADNTFELRVHPWDSDQARAYVEASRAAGLLFRVGRNSNRLTGMLA